LNFTPGERSVYPYYGIMLLSYVLTHLTGETYPSYLGKHVLPCLGVSVYATSSPQYAEDAIVQVSKSIGTAALTLLPPLRVPASHDAVKKDAASAFGLRASAESIFRFLGTHAAYRLGGRERWTYHDEMVADAHAIAHGLSELKWALTLNTREDGSERAWGQLVFEDVQDVWGRFVLGGR
jgi:CubicO group peptidase (beta-lactamase class C family)